MGTRVLIVEDEVLVAMSMQKYLLEAGFPKAVIAIDYVNALEMLRQHPIDLALLDVNISGSKSGVDLAHFIKQHYPQLLVIFITSYSDNRTIEEIKNCQPAGYLSKPVKKIDLLMAVELAQRNMPKPAQRVTLQVGTETYILAEDEIIYAKADDIYVTLVCTGKKLLLRMSLKKLLSQLPEGLLVQVNRGIAVNKLFVEKITATNLEIRGEIFKISDLFRENFV